MKTLIIETYTYDELSEKAKAVARDWFREASAGDNFEGEFVIDDAKDCLAHAGFAIDKVYYSGFWSQGDGACFEGTWGAAAVKPGSAKEYAPQDRTLHGIAAEVERIAVLFPQAGLRVKPQRGHYNEYCTEFTVWICDENGDEIDNEIDSPEREKAEKDLIEVSRDAMRWISRRLQTDYEWRNEDEQVADMLRVNEYAFTADGKRSVIL
jgi:hypothetical protein